jgi:hypothetical protein
MIINSYKVTNSLIKIAKLELYSIEIVIYACKNLHKLNTYYLSSYNTETFYLCFINDLPLTTKYYRPTHPICTTSVITVNASWLKNPISRRKFKNSRSSHIQNEPHLRRNSFIHFKSKDKGLL